METDLSKELRSWIEPYKTDGLDALLLRAANEIEHLRALVSRIKTRANEPWTESLDHKALQDIREWLVQW